jgi:hypothetical protein
MNLQVRRGRGRGLHPLRCGCTLRVPGRGLVTGAHLICSRLLLQLANTEEYIDGQFAGNLGEVLIRWVARTQEPWPPACLHGASVVGPAAAALGQEPARPPQASSGYLSQPVWSAAAASGGAATGTGAIQAASPAAALSRCKCRQGLVLSGPAALAPRPCRCNNVMYMRGVPEEEEAS